MWWLWPSTQWNWNWKWKWKCTHSHLRLRGGSQPGVWSRTSHSLETRFHRPLSLPIQTLSSHRFKLQALFIYLLFPKEACLGSLTAIPDDEVAKVLSSRFGLKTCRPKPRFGPIFLPRKMDVSVPNGCFGSRTYEPSYKFSLKNNHMHYYNYYDNFEDVFTNRLRAET